MVWWLWAACVADPTAPGPMADCVGDVSCLEDCAVTGDEDGDGLADCRDAECAGAGPCVEVCEGGVDEDADGLVDCEDSDCFAVASCVEDDCTDRSDNDGDGSVDCEDDDCWHLNCAPKALEVLSGEFRSKRIFYQRDSEVIFTHSGSHLEGGSYNNTYEERLYDASGILTTYNAFGARIGSCSWSASELVNLHILYLSHDGYTPIARSGPDVNILDPSPVVFGPGCVAPDRVDVLPPTVVAGAGKLFWSTGWSTYGRYGSTFFRAERPVEPWAVGDHTRTVSYAPSGVRTSIDIWTNLHTEAPLERP